MNKLLGIKNLTVAIGDKKVIDDVSIDLEKGQILALVGESGSGKTMTALAVLDLLPPAAKRLSGSIEFKGSDIANMNKEAVRSLRGNEISMVFQEPFTALNPVIKISVQIEESIFAHEACNKKDADEKMRELLSMVKLSFDTGGMYPHEMSGGMRQRAMLAMALCCSPDVLILDEPTTALDVSIQKEMLDLIKGIQTEKGMGIIFVTHDFSVVNMIADSVCVMRGGQIVEKGEKQAVLTDPKHKYTKKLIDCIPRLGDTRDRLPE